MPNDSTERPDFDDLLATFIAGCQERFDRGYPEVLAKLTEVKFVVRNRSAKYIAIDRTETNRATGNTNTSSVHCFVAAQDGSTRALGPFKQGDVLKAASYKVPARGARGNIFDDHNGLGRMGEYGPAYNK